MFLESLKREHDVIETVTLALVTFAESDGDGDSEARRADGAAFCRFFRLYAGRFHHGREEELLFPALVRETEAPADRGPIVALLAQHRSMEAVLGELERALVAPAASDRSRAPTLARTYASALLRHIDAENSVLIPESETRFRRASVVLDDVEPNDEERAARDAGVLLAKQYAPAHLPDLIRGDGCPGCPSFGVDCDGVEREWSSDLEWDDMLDRIG